ncbi:MAG: hypothetical protein AAF914_01345 [Pseudomonadota bacterium]
MAQVSRRHVLFIPGFDPAPARAHRERYRREGAAQAAISGYRLSVTAVPGAPDRWETELECGGLGARARIEVLVWSDLVRSAMAPGPWSSYAKLIGTAWAYIGSGALFRLMRLRKGPVIAALYPVAGLIAQGVLALCAGMAVGYLVLVGSEGLLAWIGGLGATASPWAFPAVLAVCAALVTIVLVLRAFRRWDGRVLVHYLMQDYAFAAAEGGAYPAALNARLSHFAARIAQAVDDDVDEVLVIGHSSGAYLAVSAVAEALADGLPAGAKRISLLTLGHVVPMVSFLPRAHRLRTDLAALSMSEDITWVDVSAPGDGCAFALCDPVSVTGVARPGKRWPVVLSAAFRQTLSPETWAALRWRFFRLHFQYMCAFDRPGDYDYFAITSGPVTLADRFSGRAPSASRIETPVNQHRSVGR